MCGKFITSLGQLGTKCCLNMFLVLVTNMLSFHSVRRIQPSVITSNRNLHHTLKVVNVLSPEAIEVLLSMRSARPFDEASEVETVFMVDPSEAFLECVAVVSLELLAPVVASEDEECSMGNSESSVPT